MRIRHEIYHWLSLVRDRELPDLMVNAIDWLRYEVFYPFNK